MPGLKLRKKIKPNIAIHKYPPITYNDDIENSNWNSLCNELEATYERYLYYSQIVWIKDAVSIVLLFATVLVALLTAYSSMDIAPGATAPQPSSTDGPSIQGGASTVTIVAALLTVATATIQSFLDKRSRYTADSTASKLYKVIEVAKLRWLNYHDVKSALESYKAICRYVLEATSNIEAEHSQAERNNDGTNQGAT